MPRRNAGYVAPEWAVLAVADDAEHPDRYWVIFTSADRFAQGLRLELQVTSSATVMSVSLLRQNGEAGDEVTTRLLRSIPLADLVTKALAALRQAADDQWQAGDHREETMLRSLALRSVPLGRPGRRGHPDSHYARLALAYENWFATPDRPPLPVLAKELHISESALRAQLHTARSKGFLTKTPRGRAGGVATDKAKALLTEGEA